MQVTGYYVRPEITPTSQLLHMHGGAFLPHLHPDAMQKMMSGDNRAKMLAFIERIMLTTIPEGWRIVKHGMHYMAAEVMSFHFISMMLVQACMQVLTYIYMHDIRL